MTNIAISSTQTVYLFSHGLANYGKKQVQKYKPLMYLEGDNTIVHFFDYPDALHFPPFVDPFKTSLGQEKDVATLKKEYDFICQMYPNAQIILIGMSRGAVTISNFLSIHKPKRVAEAVLETPYDNRLSVVNALKKQLGIKQSATSGHFLLEFVFKKYKRNGLQAIDYVAEIPHNIPVLFICSKEDQRVPHTSTETLCTALRNAGHEDCYLLTVEYGKHDKIVSYICKDLYTQVAHSFYKQYSLPHDNALTLHAQALLTQCR